MAERLPLLAAQHGIWTGQLLEPDSPAFNTAEYVEIRGPADIDALVSAIRRTVAETDALNVWFTEDEDGPAQYRDEAHGWSVHVADLSGCDDPLATARAWMAADLARPVDFTADPVFGHAVFRIGPERVLWYHRVHHIALDGYGLGLVARRVAEVYTARVEGREPPPCPFGPLSAVVEEDVAYQASDRCAQDRDHWLAYTADRPEPVTLAGRSGPLPHHVLRWEDHLDRATVDALNTVAPAAKAFWPDVVTAAFAGYVHRMTGADQVNLALPVMSRMGSVSLRVPCMVLNVVPVWVPVGGDVSLVGLTALVAAEIRGGRAHHRYRYERLRRDLRLVASDRKLFGPSMNIMPFDYGLRFGDSPGVVRNVSAGLVEDMVVNVYDRADGSGLTLTFDANPSCYRPDELADHLRRFRAFLAELVAHPERPIAAAGLPLPEERDRLLGSWNDTTVFYPPATVPELLEAQVARTPDRTALVAEDGRVTFAELNARANRLARYLLARGAGPERVVAIALPRTMDAIVALFAVLKAGAAYLPVDPDYPRARVDFLLADARPVITIGRNLPGEVAPDDPEIGLLPDHDLTDAERPTPDTALALIYTSGSTGAPKGTVLTHDAMVNLFHQHRTHLIEPEVAAAGGRRFRAALTASLSFDTSWEGLIWLLAGHELHFIGDDVRRAPEDLLRYVADEGIDFLDVTPTYAEELVAEGLLAEGTRRPAVIALGGEAVGEALWKALRAVPGLSVYNLYGPTECTVDALWCRLSESDSPVIGRPIANCRAYVLDAAGRLVPPGVVGELHLAGTPVGRGYHGKAELTAQRFRADPFGPPGARMYRTGDLARWRRDGVVEFLGRADDQLKVRGFRIEPGEVESVLAGHPGVARAAVAGRGDRLVAYVVPDGEVEPAALRRYLVERLPDYLVPGAFVMMDHLPVNPNGKLDRAALPSPEPAARAISRTPRTQAERELCALFAELLGVPEVGIDDDFFTLGGHSLLVARLLTRIRVAFGVRLGIRAVFDAPTVAELARHLDTSPPETAALSLSDLDREADLDPAITADGCLPAREPRRVLLTGATGFLGAFLLRALLDHSGVEVVCLVRAEDDNAAAERLRQTLHRYRLRDPGLADRTVVALAGDLAQPDLGLGRKRFAELAEDIDAVYHNGARVNHLEPYARLRPVNVSGTQEILRLATTTRVKPVHFVSTCDFSDLSNGYVASKWVSERLVTAAGARGVPVTVYRPSRVAGHSITGVGNTGDAFWNLVRAMVILGAAPVVGAQTADLVPADHVAAAIVHLSVAPESAGRTYHLTSPSPVPIALVIDVLRRRGYSLTDLSPAEWTRRLTAKADKAAEIGDYRLSLVTAHLGDPDTASPAYDHAETTTALSTSTVPSPLIDAETLHRYLDHLLDVGFLPPPTPTE
ncbi:non-ribosomal peptide synthetase [Actinokineospora fastidiosa]|uniref:Carrier domain-containing protein n=1 Tax=Actinokineospora fastidiosa TaxID=1816 RepID=A0A918GPH9_9PSEU|nr:non-ribosomal peptide synthetase [Actinokineospora fastidiosa]GGS49643.1 hypothetical protein GCM10010171_50960 [Actinokineospora fastidiosa]